MSPLPHNGTDTSRAAAARSSTIAGADCNRILEAIRAAGSGGMTCDEVELRLGLSHQTASARINDLAGRLKSIHATDARRKTRSGSQARVYRIGPRLTKPEQLGLAGLLSTPNRK